MKKWLMRGLLLAGYCIPYAFLAMYGDAMHGTMLLYLPLLAGFGGLCFLGIKCSELPVLILGNLVSWGVSYGFLQRYRTEWWSWYFKPFAAGDFLLAISIAAFLVQMLCCLHAYRKRKAEKA